MQHDPADDFLHPALPAGHPQRPHVLYRLDRRAFVEAQTRGLPAMRGEYCNEVS
jgi:hypothetical protein